MAYFSKPEEFIDYWYDAFQLSSNLGLEYVGYAEERLIPKYPAVMIGDIAVTRELHATHQFAVNVGLNFFVYHAKLTNSRVVRTREDLQLVTRLRNFLHADFNCKKNRNGQGDGVYFSFVTDETPAIFRRNSNEAVILTRIGWEGQAINPF